jgi:hypothetical protein
MGWHFAERQALLGGDVEREDATTYIVVAVALKRELEIDDLSLWSAEVQMDKDLALHGVVHQSAEQVWSQGHGHGSYPPSRM